MQKQPSKGVLMKRRPEKTRQIHRRTPTPTCNQKGQNQINLKQNPNHAKTNILLQDNSDA